MSYILEALRKSEQERTRGATPDITTQHERPPEQLVPGPRSSRLPWFVGGALVLNAVVLAAWLLRPAEDATTTTPGAVSPETTAAPVAAPAPADQASAATPAAAEDRTPAGYAVRAAATSAPPPPSNTAVAAQPSPTVAPVPAPEPEPDPIPDREPEPEPVVAATPAAVTPLAIRDLPDRVQRRIPQLDFATHIYGDDPRYREVTINGRRYGEGERVEGMLLSEITESGVVFDFEGYRFAVSVLEDWDY